MVTLVKHEWHQVDSQFALELDEDLLSEIYPDLKKRELKKRLKEIENGEYDIEDLVNDAYEEGVDLDWDRQYDDWWTDRKGGYDITYELGDDSSWVEPNKPPEPTHKCTKCKWKGQSYEAGTQYLREDGTIIENYMDSDEICESTHDVCPMCDSELELTEVGIKEENERKERQARWDKEALEFESEQEAVPCYSCNTPYKESELEFLGGQYICPSCGEGWVMKEDRTNDIEDALEELKQEFEQLLEAEEQEVKPKKKKKK